MTSVEPYRPGNAIEGEIFQDKDYPKEWIRDVGPRPGNPRCTAFREAERTEEMSDDIEVEAIRAAYAAIKGLDRRQWTRALEYLATRMAEDDRASHIALRLSEDFLPPTQYVLAGELSDPTATPEEAVSVSPSRFRAKTATSSSGSTRGMPQRPSWRA